MKKPQLIDHAVSMANYGEGKKELIVELLDSLEVYRAAIADRDRIRVQLQTAVRQT